MQVALGDPCSQSKHITVRYSAHAHDRLILTEVGPLFACGAFVIQGDCARSDLHEERTQIAKLSETGRWSKYAYSAFREAIDHSCIKLLAGQLTHVLLHTFASHFMINGANILAFQRILGCSSLAMTVKYAHLAQDRVKKEMLNLLPGLNGA